MRQAAAHGTASVKRLPGLLPILLLLTLTSYCIGFYNALAASYQAQKARALEYALNAVQSSASKYAEAIDIYLDGASRQAAATAAILDTASTPALAAHELDRLRQQVDGAMSAMLVDAQGHITQSSPESLPAGIGAVVLKAAPLRPGPLVLSATDDAGPILLISQAVPANSSSASAVFIVLAIRLQASSQMDKLISDQTFKGDALVYLKSSDGQIMYSSDHALAARALNTFTHVERPGATLVSTAGTPDMALGFAPLGGKVWTVFVVEPLESIIAPVRTLLADALRKSLLPALIGLLLFSLLAYAVAAPLRRLRYTLAGQAPPGPGALARNWYSEAALLSEAVQTTMASHAQEVGRLNLESQTDPLTQLYNRRALDETLDAWRAQGKSASVIALDLDHFKNINDSYGHAAGDTVLVALAATIRQCIRDGDLAFRVGGEEFIVLLPSTAIDTAIDVAERVRAAVASTRISEVGHVSLSGGISYWKHGQTSAPDALDRADQALYSAKEAGRNRIVVWPGPD